MNETGDDGRLTYHGRFDEDDFEGAYCEFESRYLAGEGAAFAEAGSVAMEWVIAVNRGDLDRAFGELMAPGVHTENRSRIGFSGPLGQRSRHELRRPEAMVASTRTWPSAVCWLPNGWFVVRLEREAVGRDGETYAWTWLNVSAVRDGRFESSCLFDPEDEEAAFAYAEERMQATASRLAVTNRAAEVGALTHRGVGRPRRRRGVTRVLREVRYDDHRRFSGDPIDGIAGATGGYRAHLARSTASSIAHA